MNLAQNVAKLHPGTDIVSMALEGLFTLTCGQRPLLDASVIWGAIKLPWRKTLGNPCQGFQEFHGPGLSNKCCFAIRFPCPNWLGLPPDVSCICHLSIYLSIYLSIESNLCLCIILYYCFHTHTWNKTATQIIGATSPVARGVRPNWASFFLSWQLLPVIIWITDICLYDTPWLLLGGVHSRLHWLFSRGAWPPPHTPFEHIWIDKI